MLHARMTMKHRSSCVCLICRQVGCSTMWRMLEQLPVNCVDGGKGPRIVHATLLRYDHRGQVLCVQLLEIWQRADASLHMEVARYRV